MEHQLNRIVKIEKRDDSVAVTIGKAEPRLIPIDFLYLGLAIATDKCPIFPPYKHQASGYIHGEYTFADKLVYTSIDIVDTGMPLCSICVLWNHRSNLPKSWFITADDIPKLIEVLESWV